MRAHMPGDGPGPTKTRGMPKGSAKDKDMADDDPKLNKLRQRWRAWKIVNPVRQWRLSNQLNVEAAAAACEIPYGTYIKWEAGQMLPKETIVTIKGDKVSWDTHMLPRTGIPYHSLANWFAENPMIGAAASFKRFVIPNARRKE